MSSFAPEVAFPRSVSSYEHGDAVEISLVFILIVLAANAFFPPVYELSTRYTPAPSYHLKHIHSRFLFLSFKLENESRHYKGRESVFPCFPPRVPRLTQYGSVIVTRT